MKTSLIYDLGAGQSEKLMKVEYKGNKYIKNNFIDKLKKITTVIIPDIKYKHVYHYQKNDIYGQTKFFNPIKTLTLDDLSIEKTIKNAEKDLLDDNNMIDQKKFLITQKIDVLKSISSN